MTTQKIKNEIIKMINNKDVEVRSYTVKNDFMTVDEGQGYTNYAPSGIQTIEIVIEKKVRKNEKA